MRVVIAGTGVAGAVAACDLRRRGFATWMLEVPSRRAARGIEAIPDAGVAAMEELGLSGCLRRAGAAATRGFDNAWAGGAVHVVDGTWFAVERERLASWLRDEAIARGARLVSVERIPALRRGPGGFVWAGEGLPASAEIAIDATGRAAVWTRPTVRAARRVATLFRGPGSDRPRRGRIVRREDGWAYALFHPHATTVGIVAPVRGGGEAPAASAVGTAPVPARGEAPAANAIGTAPRGDELPADLVRALALPDARGFHRERRCAAHAQWAESPVHITDAHAQFAIGDAAFAYEPLAGQGIRFAIATASAAAACVETLHAANCRDAVALYYRELVDSARGRHRAHADGAGFQADPVVAPERALQFAAELVATGIRHGDRIVPDVGVRLATGELARWLGPLDLLALDRLARSPRRADDLGAALRASGIAAPHADAVLRWCVGRGVLRVVDSID